MSPGGGKQQLTARLVAALDGAATQPAAEPVRREHAGAQQLTGELTLDTVIPTGQRCSQEVRRFFTAQIGPSLRFDGPMREFVATGAGRTLGDAVEAWRTTRDRVPSKIGSQFELNRFLRDWHGAHPEGKRPDALEAWRLHRSLPVEARRTPRSPEQPTPDH